MKRFPLNKKQFSRFIPHRDEMNLIDFVNIIEDNSIVATAMVKEHCPAAHENYVDVTILIELVAQATGILVGWKKQSSMSMGGAGLMVGIKKANFFIDKIKVGSELEIASTVLHERDNYGIFNGEVKLKDKKIAEITIQALRPDKNLINFNIQEKDGK